MSLINSLQIAFPFTKREIEILISTAPRRYKVHFIEKRNGRGKRLIAQPTAELKAVQRWIVSTYINRLPVHPAAMAYRASIGIKDHAQIHAPNKYLLKLDFKDFFPSILGRDLRLHLDHFLDELTLPDRAALINLLFRLDSETRLLTLSIGAPSSPFLSNTIMYGFDLAVSEYCEKSGISYSRYADDLALSTNTPRILIGAKQFIESTCETLLYPRVQLNHEKTVFTSQKYRRQLTGLILSNQGTASLGRERKREIRSMAHHFGLGQLSPERIVKLRGLLAFAHAIDTDYVDSINRMLGDEAFYSLTKGKIVDPNA